MAPDSNVDESEKILPRLIQVIMHNFLNQGRQGMFSGFNLDFQCKLFAGSGGYWADGGNSHAL